MPAQPNAPGNTRRRFCLAAAALALEPTRATAATADWTEGSAEQAGLRPGALDGALLAGESLPALRALLVARAGVLVAERYYGGAQVGDLQPINSATKSVCSALVGLALHNGQLRSLDQTVAQLIPEAVTEVPGSPAAALTLRQVLSGRSGMAFDPMRYRELVSAKPFVPYALSRPALPVGAPGWSYNDALVALVAPILQRAQGADLAALATRQLFQPLGIERFGWQRDRDGHALAPAGLALRPRDLLKFAALMADGGRWQGQQLLPAAWVQESLAPQGPATWRAEPVEDVGYGLLWFTGRLHGQRVAWAWGYGGQFALLAPGLKLAVATAATSPHPSALREQTHAVMGLVSRVVEAAL